MEEMAQQGLRVKPRSTAGSLVQRPHAPQPDQQEPGLRPRLSQVQDFRAASQVTAPCSPPSAVARPSACRSWPRSAPAGIADRHTAAAPGNRAARHLGRPRPGPTAIGPPQRRIAHNLARPRRLGLTDRRKFEIPRPTRRHRRRPRANFGGRWCTARHRGNYQKHTPTPSVPHKTLAMLPHPRHSVIIRPVPAARATRRSCSLCRTARCLSIKAASLAPKPPPATPLNLYSPCKSRQSATA